MRLTDSVAEKSHKQWKVGLITIAFLALITSLPQLYLVYVRGSDWNGSCVYLDTDEFGYAAYTNALVDNRPRRSDPYSGKDDGAFESFYSIQFLPAYNVALPAKIFHLSTSTAFIILLTLATVATGVMLLWILSEITGSIAVAGIGTIGVICLGTIAALHPFDIVTGLREPLPLFPLFRRYIPALPYPVWIATALFMWRALTRNANWAILAGLGFAILVYSYFFLWTATAAWFVVLLLLWFLLRPADRRRVWQVCAILLSMTAGSLIPYAWLLTHRAPLMDSPLLLEATHAPDLFRSTELYGLLLICAVAYLWKVKKIDGRDPRFLFSLSLAVAPFLIFNQQVVTGRSLQPFHYGQFVTNYWVVLAGFIVLGTMHRHLQKRTLIYLAFTVTFIGVLIGVHAARVTLSMNVQLDEARAVVLRLREENNGGVVLTSDLLLANAVVMNSRNPVLWARHLYTFSNTDLAAQRRRFFQFLYYLGIDENRLAQDLQNDFVARWEIFGAQRANPVLGSSHTPITQDEINNSAKEYGAFANSFDSILATSPSLSYALVSPNADLRNLDKWYDRTLVQKSGPYVLYRLQVRVSR
jgi:hypothetical protein